MPDTPRSSQSIPVERNRFGRDSGSQHTIDRRGALAEAIPRRPGVSWWLGIVLAVGFATLVTPAITAEHWLLRFHVGSVTEKHEAPFTVRAPLPSGYDNLRVGGALVVARGEIATRDEAAIADAAAEAMPRGPLMYVALFALTFILAAVFSHHMQRSTKGRLVRVQVVSLAAIAVLAIAVKIMLLSTALSALVVPVAVLAMVPTMALDRIVGLATGVLAALVVSLLAPFDVGLAILLLVQAATAGLVIAERPRRRWIAALTAGLAATLCTAASYLLLSYLTTGRAPELRDPLHSAWFAAAIGPAVAAVIAVPLIPLYQLAVGEITLGRLFALEDLGHPLLRQIARQAPGTWQHSLMMANMAEIAANAIGAHGRLVRVGAYFHDLGKSLQAKYFIENLEAGETSPHDQLPPEVSCDAIFAHVTEGIVAARKAGLHERIVDFMHMHHGNGVLEYFWAKCREQGNPHDFTIEQFRYPGHPPQSRETAILAICDAVEAASRTLKKPDPASIDSLVQRIVYGKLHLGQLDESGLSMSDLRRISDSLRETIRHANHGRIEYPWQTAGQDASASGPLYTATAPRLDSLDRKPQRDSTRQPSVDRVEQRDPGAPPAVTSDDALAATADLGTANREPAVPAEPAVASTIRAGTRRRSSERRGPGDTPPAPAAAQPDAASTLTGRAPGPLPASPDVITPHIFEAPAPAATAPMPAARPPAAMPELDNAITNPPPLRRGPSGHPPVPSDPTQLAAALASLVSRVSAAPFGPAVDDRSEPAELARTGTRLPDATGTFEASAAGARRPGEIDSAATQPMLPITQPIVPITQPMLPITQPHRIAELDNAIAQPALAPPPLIIAPRHARAVDTSATTRQSVPIARPVTPSAGTARPPTAPPRTSGLADERARDTQRGRPAAGVPVAIRERAPTHDTPFTDSGPVVFDDAQVTIPRKRAEPDRRGLPHDDEPDVWTKGLADRIDAALDSDEWGSDTPIAPPTTAQLRALLGQPDPTRQQSLEEIERLHRQAIELADDHTALPFESAASRGRAGLGDPPRRSPHPTAEVDPDDIEAAIEVAPPARRPTHVNAIGAARPKKPPNQAE